MALALTADNLKIAVVDMSKVVEEYYKTRIVEANLKRQADLYQDYAKRLLETIQKLDTEFKSLRDASLNGMLTEAARQSKKMAAQDKYRELEIKKIELRNYNREKQSQLRDERDRERAKILKDINQILESHAALGGFSLILDKSSESPLSGMKLILYSAKTLDITDLILRDLNAGMNAKPQKTEQK